MGTIGPLKLISELPENFIVMNSDVITNLNLSELYNHHILNANVLLTVATHKQRIVSDFGVLEIDLYGRIIGFQEKPSVDLDVSMGIYVMNKNILHYIPDGEWR